MAVIELVEALRSPQAATGEAAAATKRAAKEAKKAARASRRQPPRTEAKEAVKDEKHLLRG